MFQKFSGLTHIIFAYLRRFNRLALLTYGRFQVTWPNSPYALARRLIARSDMYTRSSCSSSVFTIRAAFLRSHFSLPSISRSTRIVVSRFLPRSVKLPKHLVASYLLIIFWTEVLGRSISVTIWRWESSFKNIWIAFCRTVGRKIIRSPSTALFFLSFLLYGNQLRNFY